MITQWLCLDPCVCMCVYESYNDICCVCRLTGAWMDDRRVGTFSGFTTRIAEGDFPAY